MRKFIVLLLVCVPLLSPAQFTYVLDQSIPAHHTDDDALTLPWAGGLNSAQYNTLDINGDNNQDLVLFDRMANAVKTFLNAGDHYTYAPEYESLFPELTNWVLLRDYNCDGKKDIFTGDILGVRVFTNVTEDGGPLAWSQFFFFVSNGLPKSEVLLTKGFSGLTNLQLNYDDLPSITDVDGDGDLDIMTFRFAGYSSVEFHKNFSQERLHGCDSLDFERVTQTWGDFTECSCGEVAFNNTTCPESNSRVMHAGGKSILAIDLDDDHDMDLLFSEATCTNLYLLKNEGDAQTPVFTTDVLFPGVNPANILIFPSAFYEDVDFDGVNDLMVVPNIYTKAYIEEDLQHSNWFYKNTGTQQVPSFSLVKKDFMQDEMIDVGDDAVPAFFDLDNDGDLDLFIGQDTQPGNETGSIVVYDNSGSASSPAYTLATDDFLGISTLHFYNIKPQFYDVNNDGKTDLVFSATSTITGQTALYYVLNKRSNGGDFSGQQLNIISFSMLFSENVHITDVNKDGKPDILAGRSDGSVEYWENTGAKGTMTLSLEEDAFLGLSSSIERQSAAITTADLNNDGDTDLVLGDQYGTLSIVDNYQSVKGDAELITDIIFDEAAHAYITKKLGGRVWPTTAKIFGSSKPALVVGNILGGLHILRHDNGTSLSEIPDIRIYPNPVSKAGTLNISVDRYSAVQIFSVMGQQINTPFFVNANEVRPVTFSGMASGIYIIRIETGGRSYSRRVVVY